MERLLNGVQRALAVFAHPDDAELTAFGLLAKLADAGVEITVLVTAEWNDQLAAPHRYDRIEEARQSISLIGGDVNFGHLSDGSVSDSNETFELVYDTVSEIRPDLIVTHASDVPLDHQDHRAVARVASVVGWRDPNVSVVLQSEPPVVGVGFKPDVFIDVTPFAELKTKAVGCYESQAHKSYMHPSQVLTKMSRWGDQMWAATDTTVYAEAYSLAKCVA